MARLIYSAIASLDGFLEDETGSFEWAMPDAELHGFINDLERQAGTFLLGRRMYEVMVAWEHEPVSGGPSTEHDGFARLWQAAEKIVYSTTLQTVAGTRTRIEREFHPAAIRQLKAQAERDLSIGGPELAGHAFRAGLVDECHLFFLPIVVGGGKPALPRQVKTRLELLDQRRFAGGAVHLHYRTREGNDA